MVVVRIARPCGLLLLLLLCKSEALSYSLYSLTRFFVDTRKENNFEDVFEIKQRLFLEERFDIVEGTSFFNLSGKLDLNYFIGGFSRFSYSFDLFELYTSLSFGGFNIYTGRKIVSWGITDGSPFDVINRPDLSEGFFNEPKFLKVPSVLAQIIWVTENLSLELVYEPFFNPPVFYDVGGDWALMSWESLHDSFDGDDQNPQLKNILNGLFSPIVRAYPEKLTDILMSFGLGAQAKTRFENLDLLFVSYTGGSIFPVPFFDQSFLNYFERQHQPTSEKLDISALEVLEPVSDGRPFLKLEPRRYYLVGPAFSYDIDGYLIKSDIAFYLMNDLPNENMRIKEYNLLSWAIDLEREVIPNLIIIPSFRGILNLSQDDIIIIERGVLLPSFTGRYEFFIGNSSLSIVGNIALDVPFEAEIRSHLVILSLSWKPTDTIEISSNSYILGGDRVSLFGFLKSNSAVSLWLRMYF